MDQLFGDATTAMPTPAQHAEVDSLMGGRSRISSLDIRRGKPRPFSADSAIPGLDINPPDVTVENGKPQRAEVKTENEGIGGWISRMVNRSKKDKIGADGQSGQYRRIDQDEG